MELVWSFWTRNPKCVYMKAAGSQQTVLGAVGDWALGRRGREGGVAFRLPESYTGLWREKCWLCETPGLRQLCRMKGLASGGPWRGHRWAELRGRRPVVSCACGWGGNPLQTPHQSWKWQEAFFSCNVPPESSAESLKSCSLAEKCFRNSVAYHRAHIEAPGTEAISE